ncbi:hypothetical protein LWI28_010160 [Acer negundo]|uniref:non-specific serine/threonine protein kinase n=1 Tax=Acer negundo TaxID=4023 RepID=A0AAD5NIQ5_ACENE|nr:hypothetical protein LWI28_010160 [Acer negundo]KAK4837338.1 hypothetical protein QYF36_004691 [Acer negundo]
MIISSQAEEFITEVEAIGQFRHKNLVKLLGYCVEGYNRMLVYEYIDNGNLHQWLHGGVGQTRPLTWSTRLKIIQGIAKGYLATEGASTCCVLNEKSSDVYSFGVLIMEIVTGRMPIDHSQPQVYLVEWLKSMVANQKVEFVFDPKLPEFPSTKELKRIVLISLRCVDPDVEHRPKMGEVIHMLEPRDLLLDDDHRIKRENPYQNYPKENQKTVANLSRYPFNSHDGKNQVKEKIQAVRSVRDSSIIHLDLNPRR